MNEQTDIRELIPPMTPQDIRLEDKIQELERLLAYGRKWYPQHAAAKDGVVKVTAPVRRSEAFSRIAIIKSILGDYIHQSQGIASYEDSAKRLGEKE